MNRIISAVSTVAALTAFTACDAEQPLEVPEQMPIQAQWSWIMVDGWTLAPDGRCPQGHILSGDLDGTTVIPGLGAAEATISHCINPLDGSFVNGILTTVFTDGEQLTGTYSGQSVFTGPTEVEWQADIVFDGGTGPFEGASGSATEIGSGTVQLDPNTGFAVGGEFSSVVEGIVTLTR